MEKFLMKECEKKENIICACKGVRTCIVCEKLKNKTPSLYEKIINLTNYLHIEEDNSKIIQEDSDLEKTCGNLKVNNILIKHYYIQELNLSNDEDSKDIFKILRETSYSFINHLSKKLNFSLNKIKLTENIFEGFYIIKNFLSESDQSAIIDKINSIEWKESQSGRKKQDYGPKINYKKRKVKYEGEQTLSNLPNEVKSLINKLTKNIKSDNLDINLEDYDVAGVGNLLYSNVNGSHIEPHIDDVWVWGRRIIGVNLFSDTTMTFSIEVDDNFSAKILVELDIPLKAGDIYIMTNNARYIWKHSIKKEFILSDRIAITVREFEEGYKEKNIFTAKESF
jgi:alkylated DNA repair dioxygenase AlkB